MSSADAPPGHLSFERALERELRLNARRTHQVRALGVSFFGALFVTLVFIGGDHRWGVDFGALATYAGLSWATVALSRAARLERLLAMAPVALDAPAIFLVQRSQFAVTPVPSAVAGFTLGLYVTLMVVAMLSLRGKELWLTAVVAATFEVLLQRESGVSVGGMLSAIAVLLIATSLLTLSGVRRTELLRQTVRSEKLAALGQLSAGVGHDVRTPLAAITNAVFVLRRRLEKGSRALEPEVAEVVALLDRETKACQRIIGDLLDFARDQPLALEAVDLGSLVDECVGVLKYRPGVEVRRQTGALPMLKVDRARFRQVLLNLLQNAVEAIAPGHTGEVTLSATVAGGFAAIEIVDDGVGMPPESLKRLFEPLFTTKKDGTGLGLSIVASLVAQHGGTIRFDSAISRGTRVTVAVPVAPGR